MSETFPYQNPELSFDARAADLVSRMTLEEKISQMVNDAPAVERLGVQKYNWWNECLHGVARAGLATVFPQAIGLAAMWDADLLHRIASAISDEARAKHHEAARQGVRKIYTGLTFWSPNINIFRDPRWGRGQETYGEDPYLTGLLAVAFITGLQGDDPRYLKVSACAKHYAVHSGPESDRHRFNASADERDLWETYLPAFETAVREAGVESVMGAYNRTNGEACCASPTLLGDILRRRWSFDGHVTSDCGAIVDIYKYHGTASDGAEAAALAVKTGCDLECGAVYQYLGEAVERGLIDEAAIDRAVTRLMRTRFRLGMFDPPERVAYASIPYEVVASDSHGELALQAARKSLVLLKNDGILPLNNDGSDVRTIAMIGPNADDEHVLYGNYYGTAKAMITPLIAIRAKAAPGTQVIYARGCRVVGGDTDGFDEAIAAAKQADIAVVVLGLSQEVEGEEGETPDIGDRDDIALPGLQDALLRQIHGTGTPVVLVLVNGSAVAVNWADEHVPAILEAWYPGQAGGTAIAEALFGEYNPAGRLPVTFYRSVDQLPPFEDYAMRGEKGRTYRYSRATPLYPFGHGLSYTQFAYRDLTISRAGDGLDVQVVVENTGQRVGEEVVQLYVRDASSSPPPPLRHLEGFRRVSLAPGDAQPITFHLTAAQLSIVRHDGTRAIAPGIIEISVGGGQPGFGAPFVSGQIDLPKI